MADYSALLRGMASVPSDRDCPDGQSSIVVNLSETGGGLKPVPSFPKRYQIQGTLVSVHEGSGYLNLITYASNSLWWQANEDGVLTERTLIKDGLTTQPRVEVVGNTLVIVSDGPIAYVLFKDGEYKYLGDTLPLPPIEFGVRYKEIRTEDEGSETIVSTVPGGWTLNYPSGLYDPDSTLAEEVTTIVFGHINERLAYGRNEGYYAYPAYIRAAMRLFDGTVSYLSAPVLLNYSGFDLPTRPDVNAFNGMIQSRLIQGAQNGDAYIYVNGYEITFKWLGFPEEWSDIVSSVDLYLTPPVTTFDQNGTIEGWGNDFGDWYLDIPYKEDDTIDTEMKSAAQFYKVLSIPSSGIFNDFEEGFDVKNSYTTDVGGKSINDLLPEGILSTIEQQELLVDEYRVRHKKIAGCSYMYNGRLHLGNIEEDFFDGYPFVKMTAKGDTSIDISDIVVQVEIDTENGTYYREERAAGDFTINTDASFFYYPDSRAKSMTICYESSGMWNTIRLELTEHKFLNGAYYLSPNLRGVAHLVNPGYGPLVLDTTGKYSSDNAIVVSSANNPFYFPVEGNYTIGGGRVIAMASSTQAVSQGQFGQYPLYAFCKDGIWAMEVGSTGDYRTTQPISRAILINESALVQVDGAVIFGTKAGVMGISGSQSVNLSETMEGPTFDFSSVLRLNDVISKMELPDFMMEVGELVPLKKYLDGCGMAYDYPNDRVIIYNELYNYCYLYDLTYKTWCVVEGQYHHDVNDYPNSYLCDFDGGVYDFSALIDEDSTELVSGIVVTRPIKAGSLDVYKTIRELHIRGNFADGTLGVALFGSRSGGKYVPVGTAYGDEIQRMSGSGYKFYIIAIMANLPRRAYISSFTIDGVEKYVNRAR